MRLRVVGCAGSFAGPASPASCYLLSAEDAAGRTWNVLLDLGSGAFGALQRYIDPSTLDAVLLSHMHADHCADLTGLHVYLSYRPQEAGGPFPAGTCLPVWGPQDIDARVAAMMGEDPGAASPFRLHRWQPGRGMDVGPLHVEPFPVLHPVPTVALRITGPSDHDPGRSVVLAYTGDTDLCEGVRATSRGADVLLAEAAFQEGRDDHIACLHLSGARAGQLATDAAVGRLLLTHLPAWNDPERTRQEARQRFAGPLEVVEAGGSYQW